MSETKSATPNVPIRSSEVSLDAWEQYDKGIRFGSRDLPLSALGGATKLGVVITMVEPGRQSAPFHHHLREEEHFYVLEGRCVLRSGASRHEMGPGDYVCFPPGTGVAHCFENPFAVPCRFLAIGERNPDEICVYPDSGKTMVRALKLVTRGPEALDYWEGERCDEPITKE